MTSPAASDAARLREVRAKGVPGSRSEAGRVRFSPGQDPAGRPQKREFKVSWSRRGTISENSCPSRGGLGRLGRNRGRRDRRDGRRCGRWSLPGLQKEAGRRPQRFDRGRIGCGRGRLRRLRALAMLPGWRLRAASRNLEQTDAGGQSSRASRLHQTSISDLGKICRFDPADYARVCLFGMAARTVKSLQGKKKGRSCDLVRDLIL